MYLFLLLLLLFIYLSVFLSFVCMCCCCFRFVCCFFGLLLLLLLLLLLYLLCLLFFATCDSGAKYGRGYTKTCNFFYYYFFFHWSGNSGIVLDLGSIPNSGLIALRIVPAIAQLVRQRPWDVLFCLWMVHMK